MVFLFRKDFCVDIPENTYYRKHTPKPIEAHGFRNILVSIKKIVTNKC